MIFDLCTAAKKRSGGGGVVPTGPVRLTLIAALVLLLTGCGPHPGSGAWLADPEPVAGYQRLQVEFDGRAEFFRPGEEAAALRCFWAGDSATSIKMDCISAADDATKFIYSLRVLDDGQGELLLDDKVLGRFRSQEQRPD
jgi:hypothetical protein